MDQEKKEKGRESKTNLRSFTCEYIDSKREICFSVSDYSEST